MTSLKHTTLLFVFIFSINLMLSSTIWAAKSRSIWSSLTIEQELHQREKRLFLQIEKKLTEVQLFISKNDLKAASAVLTLIKANTYRNENIYFIEAYIDFRLGRLDSALRILQKIQNNDYQIQVRKCFLWLKISWDAQRWQEVSSAFNNCESLLSNYSKDELFYSKNLLNFSINNINEDNVSPSPFFYFYSPDYKKIEQWLSLLIKMNLEKVALSHLRRIPDESLNSGHVRLLTAMSLWNAHDKDAAQNLIDNIQESQKSDWNYLRLITSIGLSKNNWQQSWDTNRRVLEQFPNLLSSRSIDMLLAWKMDLLDLIKVKQLENTELLQLDHELAPISAAILFLRGLKQEAQDLLLKYGPTSKDKPEHHLGYWGVKQWISLRNNQMDIFMNDAVDSCQKKVSFGCWLLLSGQKNNKLDKTEIFPYDSVGEYFTDNL